MADIGTVDFPQLPAVAEEPASFLCKLIFALAVCHCLQD